jgi:hypothetical protein
MARPRGWAKWNPQPQTLALLGQVQEVLDEYEDYLPLTARQIFYRLVGSHGYEKTEQAYARLCEGLVRARRAGIIPFDAIRDDGTTELVPRTYDDAAAFWDETRQRHKHYSRDRLAGQDVRIELWCEAAGMAPNLQRIAFPYSIPVYSTGGFSSVTVTYEIAQRALEREVPTVFLHVGDYDPSGESIFAAMSEDAERFVLQERLRELDKDRATFEELRALPGSQLRAERVALTENQVGEYELPTAPPKRTDSRSASWEGETCQLEAMPPDILETVVDDAIQGHLNMDRYHQEVDAEQADEDSIGEVLDEV